MDIYKELISLNSSGKNAVLIMVIDKKGHGPAKPGFKMILLENGTTIGTVGGGNLEYLASQNGMDVFKERENKFEEYYLGESEEVIDRERVKNTGMICGGSISLYFEYHGIKDTLYLFGAGHVGEAILYHIKRLNYHVVLIDSREDLLKKFRADVPVFSDFPSLVAERGIDKESFFVIATYSHDLDYEMLKHILDENCNPRYIGMIASKKKSETILSDIKKEYKDHPDIEKIQTPIGLNIGGKTPDEIAISIIAELQMKKHKKKDLKWK